jgi:hypothetical protein
MSPLPPKLQISSRNPENTDYTDAQPHKPGLWKKVNQISKNHQHLLWLFFDRFNQKKNSTYDLQPSPTTMGENSIFK